MLDFGGAQEFVDLETRKKTSAKSIWCSMSSVRHRQAVRQGCSSSRSYMASIVAVPKARPDGGLAVDFVVFELPIAATN